MHSEFFCNIARINDMKGWKSLVSLRTMFHAPTRLPINIANEHTLCTSFFQLNDHQIQILKKEKCKGLLISRFFVAKEGFAPILCSFFLEDGKI